ncbi:MAG TPA: ECF-type sigma factor [Rhodanobacteraceae bacterium]|nr:ECF-type sigma factor [Rhodanobacteraceae bacterium]
MPGPETRGPTTRPAPPDTADALFVEVYDRLKSMASRELAKNDGATLNTTALVHELYMKVCSGHERTFATPAQFFSYAAQAMRHILVDRARQRLRIKRGSGVVPVELDDDEAIADATAGRAIELDEALKRLEQDDPRAAELVTLHYFAGLPLPRIAEILGVTERTLSRDWRFARAFLHDILR